MLIIKFLQENAKTWTVKEKLEKIAPVLIKELLNSNGYNVGKTLSFAWLVHIAADGMLRGNSTACVVSNYWQANFAHVQFAITLHLYLMAFSIGAWILLLAENVPE